MAASHNKPEHQRSTVSKAAATAAMATIDSSDSCLVCADPLEFTGIGVCGHKEICGRCVARMRFVLKDNACVLCKTESPSVFFTRFMGDFTAKIAPDEYPQLKVSSCMHALLHACITCMHACMHVRLHGPVLKQAP